MRAVSLIAFLFAFWVALSGHYTPFLVTAGVVSAVVCGLAALRARTLDVEGHPAGLLAGAVTYWPWLMWEMLQSAINVTRIVLDPRLPISPTMAKVTASQQTPGGLATYANSITLTPGTLTVGVRGEELTIHALTREGALDVGSGRMDARVRRFEGGS